jgi:hypothetical protein
MQQNLQENQNKLSLICVELSDVSAKQDQPCAQFSLGDKVRVFNRKELLTKGITMFLDLVHARHSSFTSAWR